MQNPKLRATDIAGIALLLILLVCVRIFQERLFYDPFLPFFRSTGFETHPLPQYNSVKLLMSLFFRYALNTLFSLGILWLIFKDASIIRLSAILYFIFFIVLAVALIVVVNAENVNMLVLFYVRRFLIQPLFLILFVPAFYYQRNVK